MKRLPGSGWLVLIGGGEFSFGETLAADRSWLAKAEQGPIGFLPTASGSADYFAHFAGYVAEGFDRQVEMIPVYRQRDSRRMKNADRVENCGSVYIGGGVVDNLLSTLEDSPVLEALGRKLGTGGVVVAIAAAAQACGQHARSLTGRDILPGFGWLPGGVVEPNFDPAHDRRLRQSMSQSGAAWGLGIAAASAVLFGPDQQIEFVGTSFLLEGPDGDFQILKGV